MRMIDSPMSPAAPALEAALETLRGWAECGRLRRLDRAFAAFVATRARGRDEDAALVAVTAALAAHMEGLGHTCIELADWAGADLAARLGGCAVEADGDGSAPLMLPASADDWAARLLATAVVQPEGATQSHAPLVLSGTTLYLRRYWRYEVDVATNIGQRVTGEFALDQQQCRAWLDVLFGKPDDTDGPDWQRVACAVALRRRFGLVTGGPGTGKTYTVARLLALLFATASPEAEPRVVLAAPTGKAAARLSASVRGALADLDVTLRDGLRACELADRIGAAVTLHKLLGARPDTSRMVHDKANPLDVDVVVVDEASMIHLGMMAALLNAMPPNARLILLGDKDQLASVEAGAVLGELCRDASLDCYDEETRAYLEHTTGTRLHAAAPGPATPLNQQVVMLRKSRRFAGSIGKLAKAINDEDTAVALATLSRDTDAEACWIAEARLEDVVRLACFGRHDAPGYASYLREIAACATYQQHDDWVRAVLREFDRFRILCALRETHWGVAGLNAAVERRLCDERLLGMEGEWYEGRPVLVTRNDAELGVSNGDVGIALKDPAGGAMRVYFADGNTLRSVLCSRLAHAETAFAMTVHKSQGSEFEHTALVLPPEPGPIATRELVYTGVTRARSRLTLICANGDVFADAIQRGTERTSALARRLGRAS